MTDDADAPSGNPKKGGDEMVPDEAFIFPDEPLVLDEFRSALISPEEPLQPREEESGIVVGMDGSTEHEATGADSVLLDPERVADVLEAVSSDLRKNGISALRIGGGMSAFEKNLRIHVAEYFSKHG